MTDKTYIRASRARLLTPNEHAAFTRYCCRTSGDAVERLFVLYSLIRYTGLRIGEALALTVGDVWDGYDIRRTLTAHTSKQRNAKRQRNLSLCSDRDALRTRLKQWVRKTLKNRGLAGPEQWQSYPLINTTTDRTVDRVSITHQLYETCDRAQIARFSWHDLRHGYGQELYDHSGGDTELVTAALGHTNPATTRKYLHPTVDRLHELNIAISDRPVK